MPLSGCCIYDSFLRLQNMSTKSGAEERDFLFLTMGLLYSPRKQSHIKFALGTKRRLHRLAMFFAFHKYGISIFAKRFDG